jgi:hypothetical protein
MAPTMVCRAASWMATMSKQRGETHPTAGDARDGSPICLRPIPIGRRVTTHLTIKPMLIAMNCRIGWLAIPSRVSRIDCARQAHLTMQPLWNCRRKHKRPLSGLPNSHSLRHFLQLPL